MTLLWLIMWLGYNAPPLHGNWLVALVVCLLIDVYGGSSRI